MKARFRVNLGSMDASKYGLDFRKCTAGAEVEIGEVAYSALGKAGVVESADIQADSSPVDSKKSK